MEIKEILINNRYLIDIKNKGVIYDTIKAENIPEKVFEIRDIIKSYLDNGEIYKINKNNEILIDLMASYLYDLWSINETDTEIKQKFKNLFGYEMK